VAKGHDVLRIVTHKPIAPIADCVQNGEEVLTRFTKIILMPRGVRLVELSPHDARSLQGLQPRRENSRWGCAPCRDFEKRVETSSLAPGERSTCSVALRPNRASKMHLVLHELAMSILMTDWRFRRILNPASDKKR
jgi:hypothetical protein